jgi:hypothetical protein
MPESLSEQKTGAKGLYAPNARTCTSPTLPRCSARGWPLPDSLLTTVITQQKTLLLAISACQGCIPGTGNSVESCVVTELTNVIRLALSSNSTLTKANGSVDNPA